MADWLGLTVAAQPAAVNDGAQIPLQSFSRSLLQIGPAHYHDLTIRARVGKSRRWHAANDQSSAFGKRRRIVSQVFTVLGVCPLRHLGLAKLRGTALGDPFFCFADGESIAGAVECFQLCKFGPQQRYKIFLVGRWNPRRRYRVDERIARPHHILHGADEMFPVFRPQRIRCAH